MKSLLSYLAVVSATDIGIPVVSNKVVSNSLLAVYYWAAAIAVIVIIVGGFYYVTSNANAQQVTRAKNAILSAVIGLIVILTAFLITRIVVDGVG